MSPLDSSPVISSTISRPLVTAGRYAATAAGTAVAVLGAVGLMSQTDAATATEAIKHLAETLGALATAIMTLAGIAATVWATVRGTLNSTQVGVVTAATELARDPVSPVKAVVVTDSPAGHELRKEVAAPGIVVAGTPAAVQIAKPQT